MTSAPDERTALAAPQSLTADPEDTPAITERGSLGACGLAISIYADLVPAGMLPCAYMFTFSGELPGIILLICYGVAHVCFSYLLVRAMETGNQNTLGNCIIYVTGLEFAWFPLTVVLIAASGCCVGYLSLILDMMPEVFPIAANVVPLDPKVIYLVPPLLILSPFWLCRNFTGLLPTSILAVVCVMCTVVIAVIRAVDGTYVGADESHMSGQHTSIQNALQPTTILTAGLFCHYNTCRYYRELCDRRPLSFAVINGSAVAAAIATFIVFAWSGYHSFGPVSKYAALNNYRTDDPLGIAARFLACVSLFGSFPLAFGGARAAGIDLCRLCRHPRCVAPCFLPQICLDKLGQIEAIMNITPRDLLAPFLLIVIAAVSITRADARSLAAILNATSSTMVFFILPPMLFMAAVPKRSGFRKGESESLLSMVGFFCGLFAAGACIYATLVPAELAI